MKLRKHLPVPIIDCPYLKQEVATIEYSEILSMEPGEYEGMLRKGWFKFGPYLQRPVCSWCRQCSSMRVPLQEWEPNRAQRRILKRNAELTVRAASPPEVSQERVELHNWYRRTQHLKYGWTPHAYTEGSYLETFVNGPLTMREITVWEGDRLMAVLMADVDGPIMTAVTHFYDPGLPHLSLGMFTILQAFLLGKTLELEWIYLGYYVPGSPNMSYKQQFHPHELRSWRGRWARPKPLP